jgi:hypothetical protein
MAFSRVIRHHVYAQFPLRDDASQLLLLPINHLAIAALPLFFELFVSVVLRTRYVTRSRIAIIGFFVTPKWQHPPVYRG